MLKARASAKSKRKDKADPTEIVLQGPAELAAAEPPPSAPSEDLPAPDALLQLGHAAIRPDPDNARQIFDAGALVELAASIRDDGLINPLIVAMPDADGLHTLIAGERRWRAIGQLIAAGTWAEDRPIPCLQRTADGEAAMLAALVDNIQRVDLSHPELADAYELLGARYHLSNRQIADKVNRSIEHVQQHRRLAKLPENARAELVAGDLTMHEALTIVSRPTPDLIGPAATLVFAEIWRRCVVKPMSIYNMAAECGYTAKDDKGLKTLVERRLVTFTEDDYSSHKASVYVAYEGRQFGEIWFKGLDAKGPAGDRALAKFRCAAGVPGYNPLAADYDPKAGGGPLVFVTPWLNGPFELSDKAKKAIADRKETARKEKAEAAERETARKAADAAANAEVEAILGDKAGRRERLAALFAELGLKGPFAIKAAGWRGEVSVAGEALIELHYNVPQDRQQKLAATLCALLAWAHAELGVVDAAPESEEPPGADAAQAEVPEAEEAEVSPALARLAGVPAQQLEPAE